MLLNVHILFFLASLNWIHINLIFLERDKIYFFNFNWFAVNLPTADKRLNWEIKKSLSELAKFILEFSKIVRDWITSRVVLPLPDSYSKVIPSFAISAAFTCDLIESSTPFEDWYFDHALVTSVSFFFLLSWSKSSFWFLISWDFLKLNIYIIEIVKVD